MAYDLRRDTGFRGRDAMHLRLGSKECAKVGWGYKLSRPTTVICFFHQNFPYSQSFCSFAKQNYKLGGHTFKFMSPGGIFHIQIAVVSDWKGFLCKTW